MSKKLKEKSSEAKTLVKEQPDNTVMKDEKEIVEKKLEQKVEMKKKFQGIADQLAEDELHHLNWYFPEHKKVFPNDPRCQYVGKMYPNAKGGKLLVDEPRFEHELAFCRLKKRELKKLGYRYVIIEPRMTLEDARRELNSGVDNSEGRTQVTSE